MSILRLPRECGLWTVGLSPEGAADLNSASTLTVCKVGFGGGGPSYLPPGDDFEFSS